MVMVLTPARGCLQIYYEATLEMAQKVFAWWQVRLVGLS